MANPWANVAPECTLLSLLAAQGCHPTSPFCPDLSSHPSLQIISSLNEISSLSQQIHSSELEILNRNLHRENRAVVDLDNLDKVARAANEIAQCIASILDSREDLLTRLRKPHQDDRLVVEARYQKYAVSAFEQLGRVLSQLTANINTMETFQSNTVSESSIEANAHQITQLTGGIQTLLENLRTEHCSISGMQGSKHATLNI